MTDDDIDNTVITDITDAHKEQDVARKAARAHEKPAPFLIVMNGDEKGKKFLIVARETKIGRASRCHLQIKDRLVSSEHAVITSDDDGLLIEDQGSTNGTIVNNQPATRCYLKNGDVIRLGKIELRVTIPPGARTAL